MLDVMRHRLALAGAVAALTAGLLGGAALKGELANALLQGRRPEVVDVGVHTPTAFEAWYPPEGAPPAWVNVGALPAEPVETPPLPDEIAVAAAGHDGDPPEPYLPPPEPPPDPPEWSPPVDAGPAPVDPTLAAAG
jgi:hypothetical protein